MPEKIHRNSLKPGYKLHWYRIEKVLGQGGFGITYLAYDFNLDRKAAIKEYLPIELAVREGDFSVHPLSEDHGEQYHWGLDRFIQEARTLAKFEHPNIVRVLNVFEANQTAYMVMSYEEGESLQEILTRRKTLEEGELLDILVPIIGGLEKVHQAGFIHRDIKPANILLRKDGNPVLLDFGSARQALGAHTKTLTSLVSPGYAPFEQYHSGSEAQGPWTDVYGLGATLYRAVAGVAPMDAVDRSRVILKGGADPYVPAMEIGRGRYSERFLRAIDHALQFREEERPQTVAEWKREFAPFGQPAPAIRARGVVPPELRPTEPAAGMEIPRVHAREAPREKTAETPSRALFRWKFPGLVALLLVAVAGLAWIYRDEARDLATWVERYAQKQAEIEAAKAEAERTRQAEQERNAKIQTLLAEARADFEALRLIEPGNDNALDGYRQVLQLDPQNSEAQQGLRAISDKLVALAQNAIAAEDFAQAESYLETASGIVPDAPNIQLARNELNLRKAAKDRAEAEAKARVERAQALLKEADTAADKGDALTTLAKLDQARALGADPAAITTVREHLRARLEALAAAATEEAQQALKAKDTARARAALSRARDFKSKADTLAAP
jgi:serine/threonine protein kinase